MNQSSPLLKLNMFKTSSIGSKVPRLDLRGIANDEASDTLALGAKHSSQACFHTEFMARVDEYSESWREAALREQRTQLNQ